MTSVSVRIPTSRPFFDDRQGADLPLVRETGRVPDLGFRVHRDDRPRHDVPDGEALQRVGQPRAEPLLESRVENDLPEIPVGHDADKAVAAVQDAQVTDPSLSHQSHRINDLRRPTDRQGAGVIRPPTRMDSGQVMASSSRVSCPTCLGLRVRVARLIDRFGCCIVEPPEDRKFSGAAVLKALATRAPGGAATLPRRGLSGPGSDKARIAHRRPTCVASASR